MFSKNSAYLKKKKLMENIIIYILAIVFYNRFY